MTKFLVDQQLPRALASHLTNVTCGNISTADLLALVDRHHAELSAAIDAYRYIEIDRPGVIIHDPS